MADEKTTDLEEGAKPRPGDAAPKADNAPDPANVKDHISRHLRLMYDTVASQPIPDRFLELLNQLDDKGSE